MLVSVHYHNLNHLLSWDILNISRQPFSCRFCLNIPWLTWLSALAEQAWSATVSMTAVLLSSSFSSWLTRFVLFRLCLLLLLFCLYGTDEHLYKYTGTQRGLTAQISHPFLQGALVSALADDSIHLWNLRQKIPAILHSLKFNRERYSNVTQHLSLWLSQLASCLSAYN